MINLNSAMATRTIISTTVALLVSISAYAQPQEVPLNWVHGLGEDETTWEIYRARIDGAREADGINREYDERIGMRQFAREVETRSLNQSASTGNRSLIGVGHSIGGIALRDDAQSNPALYRGVITVGSPNRGGAIVDAVDEGRVRDELERACRQLAAGPTSELAGLARFGITVELQGRRVGFDNNDLCRDTYDALLRDVINGQAAGASAQDIRPGAAYLAGVNAGGGNVPVVSVRGEENSPVHWRLASSIRSNYEDDTVIADAADKLKGAYTGLFIARTSLAVANGVLSFFNPERLKATIYNAFLAVQWNRGRKWFGESEQRYLELIDCIPGREWQTTGTRRVILGQNCNTQFPTGSPEWVNCVNQNPCRQAICWGEAPLRQYVAVRGSSDGFFCEEAQVVPGANPENIYVARGVNHHDETNTTFGQTANGNDEMQRIFNEIYNGRGDGETDPFFIPLR